MTIRSGQSGTGYRDLTFFFPMASPEGPVGYARLGAGVLYEGWEELPVEGFDVSSVADAWASLHNGSLWPAVPPKGTLRWQGSFLGTRDQIASGRLRGRSAHLSILLLATAWQNDRLAGPDDDGTLRVWATGELDGEGRLLPVDQLGHKLRIFLEHWTCHPGPAVFIAPAATRSGINPDRFRAHQPLEEIRFDPHRLPSLPEDKPTLLWVNRGDTGALGRWLCGPARPTRSQRLFLLALVALLLAGTAAVALSGVFRTPASEPPPGLPPPLEGARLALRAEHTWQIDADAAQQIEGVETQDGYIVWQEPLTNYRSGSDNVCTPGFMLPADVTLKYALGPRDIHVAASGNPSEVLSVLAPPRRYGWPMQVLPEQRKHLAFFRQQAFYPSHTVLGKALVEQVKQLVKENVIQDDPLTAKAVMQTRMELFNGFHSPVHLVYQAVGCCGPANECFGQHIANDVCPLPSPQSTGSMSRSFRIFYVNPSHSYLGLHFGGDRRNRADILLDEETIAGCRGPHSRRTYVTNTYPSKVVLKAEKTWSHVYNELSMAVVATGLSVAEPQQSPHPGMVDSIPPVLSKILPGWTGSPVFLFEAHFDQGIAPFRERYKAATAERRRLRLERTAPDGSACAVCALQKPARGSWTLSYSVGLLTDQSIMSVCIEDRSWKRRNCVTLNNSNENGQHSGLHLLCNTPYTGQGTRQEQEIINHSFDPPANENYRIHLVHDDQGCTLLLNGMEVGTESSECLLDSFDQITIYGLQHSNPGHGGFVDDVVVYRQEHRSVP